MGNEPYISDTDFERLVRERAYRIWQDEGCPDGRDLAHWHQAHRELSASKRQPHFPVPALAGGKLTAMSEKRQPLPVIRAKKPAAPTKK